jgi:hypothetical protein
MFRRSIPESLVSALRDHPFWKNVIADPTLSPEIRDGVVTVYYRGGALFQALRLDGDTLVADVHSKYIPVRSPVTNVRLKWAEAGFAFQNEVHPLPPGLASPDTLAAYKRHMDLILTDFPEAQFVQQIIEAENAILDQEIAFQEPNEPRDKIDLCHYDSDLRKLVFVEVKRVVDSRLTRPEIRPEVLDQLAGYGRRLSANRADILNAYRTVAEVKRRLGLGDRLRTLPPEGASDLLLKPVLVIGDCTRADVKAIKAGSEGWGPLMGRLPEVAAGLILCGKGGCRLALKPGSQTLIF